MIQKNTVPMMSHCFNNTPSMCLLAEPALVQTPMQTNTYLCSITSPKCVLEEAWRGCGAELRVNKSSDISVWLLTLSYLVISALHYNGPVLVFKNCYDVIIEPVISADLFDHERISLVNPINWLINLTSLFINQTSLLLMNTQGELDVKIVSE